MARPKAREPEFFDAELDELPQAARWREWMGRVEAAIFAAPSPAPREALWRETRGEELQARRSDC